MAPAQITITAIADGHELAFEDRRLPCLVGKTGIIASTAKREGDGATPAGAWALRRVLYRPDRIERPETRLQASAIREHDGWCDDPASRHYNTAVTCPFEASHERLWRADHAYDVVIPLGYNDAPPIAGRGSAIFFHCIEAGKGFTEGCVAIARQDMLTLLPRLGPEVEMVIAG